MKRKRYSKQEKIDILINAMTDDDRLRTKLITNKKGETEIVNYIASIDDLEKEFMKNPKVLKKQFKILTQENSSYEYANFKTQLTIKNKSTQSFMQRYGNETYNGKTIKDYLNDLKLGLISKDDLTFTLSEFKNTNVKYKEKGSS